LEGRAQHRVIVPDVTGTPVETRAYSRIAGAYTEIGQDGAGRASVITRLNHQGVPYEIQGLGDGTALHRIDVKGKRSEARIHIPGATTILDTDGSLQSQIETMCAGVEVRGVAETSANGEFRTWFERFNEATDRWDVVLPTLQDGASFEAGALSEILGEACGLEIRVNSPITGPIEF